MRRGSTPLWARRPGLVLLIWILVSLALAAGGLALGMRTVIPGPGATQTLLANTGERLAIERGLPPKDELFIILSSTTLDSGASEFIAARDDLVAELRGMVDTQSGTRLFERVRTVGHSLFFDEQFVSDDKRHVLIIADTALPIDQSHQGLRRLPEFLSDWSRRVPWLSASYLSQGTINNEMFDLINSDLDRSLIFTLPLTLAILVWAFRSVAAALLPLILAITSLLASLGVSALVSHIIEPISATSSQLVVLLVLAIGVDYSLFILSRSREEVSKGRGFPEAVRTAACTTGRAVFWSGMTVALSLLGLLLMGDTVLTSMALVSIIAVLITLFGCMRAFPALLLWIGERRVCPRSSTAVIAPPGKLLASAIEFSVRSPWIAILCSTVVLGFLSSCVGRMALGTTVEPSVFPKSMQSRRAIELFKDNFPRIAGTDLSLIIKSANNEPLSENEQLTDFLDQLLLAESLRGPIRVERNAEDDLVRYEFVAVGSANDPQNQQLVHELREQLIPRLQKSAPLQAYISGTLPYVVDDMERYYSRTPTVFGAVLGLSFVFLLLAFRSLVIPLKAIILNMLSAAAAFGVLALVFVVGAFGYWSYGVIEAFVPALLYSILFGLSMDYHVFLLARVQEEVLRGATTRDAVRLAVACTARSITSAALIMVAVFVVIATLELPIMKELGVGLAVAVILDATLIRIVLLPASMVLLNRWNWYLPSWLKWIPRLSLGD